MRAVVIGAGVAGLATAALLAREGYEVKVLERHERVGGRAGVMERDGFRFDTGPSWYLMPEVFEHFFELLGTSASRELELVTLDPGYRVFPEPQPGFSASERFDIPHGASRVREAFEHREPGAGAALEDYLASGREALAMAEKYFLYNPFTSTRSLLRTDVLRRLPRLAALLGTSLENYAARRFTDPVLRQVLGYPAVFLGTYPARAPAMYHLMSALDLDDGVHYPLGGFWGLINKLAQLARAAGAEVITGAEAQEIVTRPIRRSHQKTAGLRGRFRRWNGSRKPRRIVGVTWSDRDGTEHFEAAEVVVSAADLHHTETRLLAERDRTYPQRWWEKRASGPGAVLTFLGVRGDLPELAHHSLFFTRDWDANFRAIFGRERGIPSPASIYVCRVSATDPAAAPAGFEQLFVLTPVRADAAIGHGGRDGEGAPLVEQVADAAIDQIAHWARISDLRQRIELRETVGPADFARDYFSWSAGMLGPGHTLGQSAMFRAQNASKRVAGLYYAGASTAPGIGVPMCLISAELVLKHLRGDTSPGPLRAGEA